MVAVAPAITVRRRLSNATQALHESLHVHRLSLQLLNQPTPSVIQAAMSAAWYFCCALESSRKARGCWKSMQLGTQLEHLQADLAPTQHSDEPVPLPLASEEAILGALYVAHGAQFGRQQIRAKIVDHGMTTLPAYYSMAVDRPTWDALLDALEVAGTSPEGFDELCRGAIAAFNAYRESLDLATPSTHADARKQN